ncbi:MAG: serine/threonine protein kinase [Deltaproteobacteria bacterium]|nr:serine/threonine protein kinase [Deltaproteobacteria bacterium]
MSPATLAGALVDGRYRVLGLIGAGSASEVFEVEHVGIGRRLAMKVLRPHLAGDAKQLERLHREARAAALIAHPGLVEVLDMGELSGGLPYLLLERLDGTDLQRTLESLTRPMGVARALSIAHQLASALAAAHVAGIVHRDVKPANVFLSPDHLGGDRVTLLDLGVALWTEAARRAAGQSRLTTTGVVIGTPLYMSPEQLWADRELDGKSDVWSLGVVLFEMLVGKPPFEERGMATLAQQIALGRVPSPRSLRPDVPAAVERLLLRMLRKEPERRPTAADLTIDLAAEHHGTSKP